jgi:hypothetical protein
VAATVAGRALTEIHRRGQRRLRAVTIADVLAVWPRFDMENLVRSWGNLERLLLAIIAARAADSATLAATYFGAFRLAEGAIGAARPVVASTPPPEELVRSLRYVGLVNTRNLIRAKVPDAARRTFVNVSGDVSRHALNAGRDTIIESVSADPRALGWARVTDSKPCSFCRMLASRGPVYRSKAGGFKAHLRCGCSAEPVFHADAPWPGQAQEWAQQWKETTQGLSGKDARKAFRQAVEGRTPAPTAS